MSSGTQSIIKGNGKYKPIKVEDKSLPSNWDEIAGSRNNRSTGEIFHLDEGSFFNQEQKGLPKGSWGGSSRTKAPNLHGNSPVTRDEFWGAMDEKQESEGKGKSSFMPQKVVQSWDLATRQKDQSQGIVSEEEAHKSWSFGNEGDMELYAKSIETRTQALRNRPEIVDGYGRTATLMPNRFIEISTKRDGFMVPGTGIQQAPRKEIIFEDRKGNRGAAQGAAGPLNIDIWIPTGVRGNTNPLMDLPVIRSGRQGGSRAPVWGSFEEGHTRTYVNIPEYSARQGKSQFGGSNLNEWDVGGHAGTAKLETDQFLVSRHNRGNVNGPDKRIPGVDEADDGVRPSRPIDFGLIPDFFTHQRTGMRNGDAPAGTNDLSNNLRETSRGTQFSDFGLGITRFNQTGPKKHQSDLPIKAEETNPTFHSRETEWDLESAVGQHYRGGRLPALFQISDPEAGLRESKRQIFDFTHHFGGGHNSQRGGVESLGDWTIDPKGLHNAYDEVASLISKGEFKVGGPGLVRTPDSALNIFSGGAKKGSVLKLQDPIPRQELALKSGNFAKQMII